MRNIQCKAIFSETNADLKNINQSIQSSLHFISKILQHNITLLIYSNDTESEKKLDIFELSFDNNKYFSSFHSIILDQHMANVASSLIFETRKYRTINHLNDFIPQEDLSGLSIKNHEQISILLQNIYNNCLKIKDIDNLNIFNFLHYSERKVNIHHLTTEIL